MSLPNNIHSRKASRVFLLCASVLAPGARNLKEFLRVIRKGKSVLQPKASLSNLFLVGTPDFNFDSYKSWIDARHDPKRFSALKGKSGELVKFTLGTCIDAIKSNPDVERVMQELDPRVAVFVATGLGDLSTQFQATHQLKKALFNWNAFWAHPERNVACRRHIQGTRVDPKAPPLPKNFTIDTLEYFEALESWNAYWAEKSPKLKRYLKELAKIEMTPVLGKDIESAKLSLIRLKMKTRKELSERYGYPTPPWESVQPQLLWNIPNLPAAQISMLLGLHGAAIGCSAACASFGVALDQGMDELISGRSDMAIVGATDISPTDELISGFYAGRLAVAGQKAGIPFCDLRGTHISGGSCIWVLATDKVIEKYGLKHRGVEILGTGVSSDAEHIITPSQQGPKLAIQRAYAKAGILPEDINMWDMHATGTPGDWNEFMLIDEFVPESAYISARKGIFGHGMAASGAWELTAQLLGCRRRKKNTFEVSSTGIQKAKVNPKIANLKRKIIYDKTIATLDTNSPICGKLSMGIGGISSCVVARITE